MITHEEALQAADKLAQYCSERWNGKIGKCNKCQFQFDKNGKTTCYLHTFLGFDGEDLKSMADIAVRLQCKELIKNENG